MDSLLSCLCECEYFEASLQSIIRSKRFYIGIILCVVATRPPFLCALSSGCLDVAFQSKHCGFRFSVLMFIFTNKLYLVGLLRLSERACGTMGCISSKASDPGDKEAIQRSAKIDRTLKNDKKTLDRTIKILLLGMCSANLRLTPESTLSSV